MFPPFLLFIFIEFQGIHLTLQWQFEDLIKKFNGSTDKIVLEMEFEKIYSAWEQWGGQKQYAGWMVWKDGKYLDMPLWDVKGFDPRRSDRSIYGSEYFMPKFLKLPLKSRMDALKFYEDEEKKWREHKIDPEIIGIYFSLNKEEYTTGTSGASSYMQKRAYDNAIKKGIKLDRMKGKYRMYFLKEKKPDYMYCTSLHVHFLWCILPYLMKNICLLSRGLSYVPSISSLHLHRISGHPSYSSMAV